MKQSDTPRTNELISQVGARVITRPETYAPAIWDHARTLERDLSAAQERIKELEGALNLLLNMEVKGHALQDRLQFTVTGRAYLDKARAALKGES